jgi:hypothetical protein
MVARTPMRTTSWKLTPGVLQRHQVRDLHAVHEVHGHDLAGGQVPVDLGRADAREVLEVLAEALRVVPLLGVVGLLEHGHAELVQDRRVGHAAREPRVAIQEGGGLAQDGQVQRHDRDQARALDLDHHVRAVVELGLVDLPDRRGRDREGVDHGEDLVHGPHQLVGDDAVGQVGVEGRHLVLQQRHLLDVLQRHQIRTRGEHLPDLHEGRPQLHEAIAQPDRAPAVPLRRGRTLEAVVQPEADGEPPEGVDQGPGPARALETRILQGRSQEVGVVVRRRGEGARLHARHYNASSVVSTEGRPGAHPVYLGDPWLALRRAPPGARNS